MERAFAWASYSCCCRDEDDDDEKECSSCGLSKEEIKKLEAQIKHITDERSSLKKEIDGLNLENDEFQQVVHELELENTQTQSKFDLSEEKRKNEKMKLFYSFMIHAMALYKNRQEQGDNTNIFDEHKYSMAPIPEFPPSFPQQISLLLDRQNSHNKIVQLQSEVTRLRRQSSLLDQQVGAYRKRENKKRQSFAKVGWDALSHNANNANFDHVFQLPIAPPLGGTGVLFMPAKPEVKPSIPMKTLHWKHLPDREIKGTIWEEITQLEQDIIIHEIGDEKKDDDISFMDKLFYYLAENDNINPQLIDKLRQYMIYNQYDSDALQDDVMDYFRGSNIYEENEIFITVIKAFKRRQDQVIGLNDLEQFFPQKAKRRRRGRGKGKKRIKRKIQLINPKRAHNVAVVLGGLKMKFSSIRYAILTMDERLINIDILLTLINIVPSPEEITKVMTYNGKINKLAECERFFLEFTKMENVKDRLQVWAFKRQFQETYSHRMSNVLAMSFMQETIRTSKNFKTVLASLLAIGNYINGGTKKGGKHGFVLETLRKIGTYKTTDNKMSVLGYLFKYLRHNHPYALEWVDEFEEAGLVDVVRIESDQLDSDITKMGNELQKLRSLLIELDDSKDENDRFGVSMYEFYNETVTKVQHLQQGWTDCVDDILDLAAFFGENVKASKFKPEEFFSIFNDFRKEFVQGKEKIIEVEEKKARKERIVARKLKRLRERKKVKQEREEIRNRRLRRARELEKVKKVKLEHIHKTKQKYLQVEPMFSDFSSGISGIDSDDISG
eukprot:507068_1